MNHSLSVGRSRNPGFTRIELLAVMATGFLLLATLAPAMMQAQADARLNSCRNKLKQFGLAMHNYHDVFNRFPMAWVSRSQGFGQADYGWQSMLLPYMDQAPLYNQLNFSRGLEADERIAGLLKTSIPNFRCILDPLGPTNELRGGWGTSNFSGNYGSFPLPRWGETALGPVPWPGHVEYATSQSMIAWGPGNQPDQKTRPNGIMAMNYGAGFRDITDGTSNTLMIGEKTVNSRSGIWPGPQSNANESDVVSDASFASPFNRSETGFSSRHRGAIPFLICDGAVRVIRSDLEGSQGLLPGRGNELGILQKLAGINDGQVIGEF